jgi:hypothetical protein
MGNRSHLSLSENPMTETSDNAIDRAAARFLQKKLNRSQILKAAGVGVVAAAIPGMVTAQTVGTSASAAGVTVTGSSFPFFPVTGGTYTTESMATILNVAQTMEYLATTLVNAAVTNASAMGISGLALQALQAALAEEAYHVEFLTSMGGTPMATTFTVPDPTALASATGFFRMLEMLESICCAAYMTANREFAELGQPLLAKFAYQAGAVEAEHRIAARTALALLGATGTGTGTGATATATAVPTAVPTAATGATGTATPVATGATGTASPVATGTVTATAVATATAAALRAHQATGTGTVTGTATGGATPSGVGTTPALSPFSGTPGTRAPIIANPIPPDNKAFATDLFLYLADAAALVKGLGFIGGTGTALTFPGVATALANSGAPGATVIQKLPNNATVSVLASDIIADIKGAGLTGLVAPQPSLGGGTGTTTGTGTGTGTS